jgi:hypothetical protein
MSKYIGNVIAQKEDLKKQLYEEVKKDIMKDIEERIKKK